MVGIEGDGVNKFLIKSQIYALNVTLLMLKVRYKHLVLRCYHNYHPTCTKYFLHTEVTMIHTHCK